MNEIKKCIKCGRTITDKNNKTGLCPKCQKAVNTIAGGAGIFGAGIVLKKFGPKLVKAVIKVVKR